MSFWVKRFINTCKWSWDGWCASWATELSLRQWTLAWVASGALAMALDLTVAERALILGFGTLVLAAELMNTGVEATCDLVSEEQHPLVKKAKDAASAAVALTAIAAGLVWLVVLVG